MIDKLEELGYTVELGIKLTAPDCPSPKAEALLSRLAADREAAIWFLIARQFEESGPKELPLPVSLPVRWEVQALALGIMQAATSDSIAQRGQYIRDAAYMIHLWAEGEDKAKAAVPAFEKAHGIREQLSISAVNKC